MKSKILENVLIQYKFLSILIILAVFGILFYTISKKKEGFDNQADTKSSENIDAKEDEKMKNARIKNILKYAQYSLTLIRELNSKDFDNILKDSTTSDFEKLNNIQKVLYPKIS
jgi:preprotein translocase subunit SecF